MFCRFKTMLRIIGARRWALALLALPLLLAGCGLVRVGYGQAPNLVYWRLDGLAGFSADQAPQVRQAIAQWFDWHRREELPRYADALARLQRELPDEATPVQVCRWLDELALWRDSAWEAALPLLAPVALSLDADQLQRMRTELRTADDKLKREILPDNAADRLQGQVQRTAQRAQRLYGRLDASQREWLSLQLTQAPLNPEAWWAERQRRQDDLLHTLNSLQERQPAAPQAQASLNGLYRRAVQTPATAAGSAHPQARQCELIAGLHNRTTPAQRATAVQRVRGWEADLRALADAARPAGERQAQAPTASPAWR
jgi:hypothetical protein